MSYPKTDGLPTCVPWHPARVVAVPEQHQLDRRAQPERDDRQVDPPRSHGRQAEDHTERHGSDDAGEQPEHERDVVHGDQPSCDEGTEAGDRVLGERELSGVAGQQHDRQQHDRHPQRDGHGVDPLRLLGQHQEHDHAAAEERPVPRHATVADHRQLLQVVVAQRERPPAEHEHDDDDEERQRWSEALLVAEPPDQRLADAERESCCGGDRERTEVTDQCRRHRGQDQRRHHRDLQGDDGHDQDAGDGGEPRAQRPVQQRDAVR